MSGRRWHARALVLAAVAVLATACGSDGDPGGDPRSASDVGVTADDIKVGFLLTDLTQAKKLLGDIGAEKEDQQAAYQAFVDEVNEDGGINDRRLSPVFTSFDPVVGDGATACNKLTEDDKVFAVVAISIFGPPVLCVTQQHGTPLVNVGGYVNEYYAKSSGLLFTTQPTKPRSARNTIAALEQEGALQGKTIGIFTSKAGDDDVAVRTAMAPALEQLGHTVAHVSNLAVDAGTAISQVPVEVTQMREARVDLVFLSTNVFFSSLFVQKADEQGYRPMYALSDADDNIGDFFVAKMPPSFQATGFTAKRTGEQRSGAPEASTDADCRTVVEKASGATLERGTSRYEVAMAACNEVRLFVRAARAAGAQLTRGAWATAMKRLDPFSQAYAKGGSFGAGKFDAADFVRPVQADMTCRCWKPTGDFERMRY